MRTVFCLGMAAWCVVIAVVSGSSAIMLALGALPAVFATVLSLSYINELEDDINSHPY